MAKTKDWKEREPKEQGAFKTWAGSLVDASKRWEDSFLELQQLWIQSTDELIKLAPGLSEEATPKQYKEFYDRWMKAYQQTLGMFYPVPSLEPNRDTLKKFMGGADDLNDFYKTWTEKLEENSRKTQAILKEEIDPERYQENFDMWIKTYQELFDGFLTLSTKENTREIFEKYTGVPRVFFTSFIQISKLWKDSYTQLFEPWIDAAGKLTNNMARIARGDTGAEAYKEFYQSWMDSFKETYDKYVQFMQPSKELFENFSESTSAYLNMYNAWMSALDKMASKTAELSREATDPEVTKEFFTLWTRMYEKAFDSFFEDMPMIGPMKQMMEPVKVLAKMYAETFLKMSELWLAEDTGARARRAA